MPQHRRAIESTTVLLLAAVIASSVLTVSAAARTAKLGRDWITDGSHGFTFKSVDRFEAVPVKANSEYVIKRYTGPETVQDWTRYEAQLDVVWVPKKGESAEEGDRSVTGEDGEIDREEIMRRLQEADRKADAISWATDSYNGFAVQNDFPGVKIKAKRKAPGARRAKSVKLPARMFTFSSSSWGGGVQMMGLELIASTDEGEFGIFYQHVSGEFDDYRKAWQQSLGSFTLIDKEQGEAVDRTAAFNEFDGEAFRKARKALLTDGWEAVDTPNYLILHNVKPKFAREIGKRLESCRRLYERMFPPKHNKKAVSVVRVCKDRDEYMRYGAPGGSAGYWSRWDKELVFYKSEGGKGGTYSVLHHEAFHQFIYYFYGEISPHSWYNEGHGDYFAGIKFDSTTHRPTKEKPFLWRTDTIKGYHQRGEMVPLEDFIRYTQRQYYAKPDLCYSQGWAFIYFLRASDRLQPEWQGILERYLGTIWQETERRNAETAEDESESEDESEDESEEESEEEGGDGEGSEEGDGESKSKRPRGLDPFLDQFSQNEEILSIAVDAAFSGIDLKALEKAFHEFIGNNFSDK